MRLAGLAGMAGLIAYLIKPACMAWATVPLPVWLRWTGVGLALIAGALLVWMFRTLGRNLTDTVVTRKQHTLVTTGPYRWVRNPMYVGAAAVIFGSALVLSSPSLVLLAGAFLLLMHAVVVLYEEPTLADKFGASYRSYRAEVRRWLIRRPAGS